MADPTATEQEHQEGQETEVPDPEAFVPKEKFDQVTEQLEGAMTFKEKAELFDQLVADPEFQKFLDDDKPKEKTPTPSPTKPGGNEDTILARLQEVIEPIQKEINQMKGIYQSDQEDALRLEADRQIDTMQRDEKNFPFFKDKDVKASMAKLLESGRAANMVDAYRLAAFDKAKAEGRSEMIGKKEKKKTILPAGKKDETQRDGKKPFSGGKLSLRDHLESAMDEHNVQLAGDDEGD